MKHEFLFACIYDKVSAVLSKCEAHSNFKLRGPLQNKTDPYYILLVP